VSVSSGEAEPSIAPLANKAAPAAHRTIPAPAEAALADRACSRSRSPRRARSRHHQSDSDVALSKLMSYLLRHGAKREGIQLDQNGFAKKVDMNKRLPTK